MTRRLAVGLCSLVLVAYLVVRALLSEPEAGR